MYDDSVVSVVIATNRNTHFLERALASVQQQSVRVGEIILVDDGAPVDLEALARAHGLRYVRQSAAGVSVARNSGAASARGGWIAFLDDDDEWHPEWLAKQLSAILGSATSVSAAYTGGWHMDAKGEPFGELLPGASVDRRDLLSGNVALPRLGAMLIRHEDFGDAGGFRDGLARGEDDHLICRLLGRGAFVGTDEPLWGYRRHGDNVTNDRFAGIRGNLACSRLLLSESRQDGDLVALYRTQLTRARERAAGDAVGIMIDAVHRGDHGLAARVAAWALWVIPLRTARAALRRLLTSRRTRRP